MATREPPRNNSLGDLPQALTEGSVDKRLEVLRKVAAGCSISQAAREVGISYKAAWQAIDTLCNLSGQALVERTVGGVGGGGATITPQGLQLLALADELAQARRQVLARFGGGQELSAGLGLRTSMRNQLPCRVDSCEPASPDDPAVWVRLHTLGGARLTASITRESADLLALAPGREVLALCKATAVNIAAVPRGRRVAEDGRSQCELQGAVERVSPGSARDEVVLTLNGGGHWVGFAPHPFKGKPGDAVLASMNSSALVIGLSG